MQLAITIFIFIHPYNSGNNIFLIIIIINKYQKIGVDKRSVYS